ncbi:hypothetical protein ACKWTF_014513 [Chironomus riparius]
MIKLAILLVSIFLGLFASTKSISFECRFISGSWGAELGTIYYCQVQNSVTITSLDAVEIDDISGYHKTGYNNDKVNAFHIVNKGKIHFFPRGLIRFFKNLKAIQIRNTGLKEIHQSDLKVFLNLKAIFLQVSQLEVLEKDLFKFNHHLEMIYLNKNKISHIDPNVFDSLTKLRHLALEFNMCTTTAGYNATELQNAIKIVKDKCENSDYPKMEKKVKNLEIEANHSTFQNVAKKLEKLEIEVQNSKFSNTFHRRLQDLKAVQTRSEVITTTTTYEEISTTEAIKCPQLEVCSALESKINHFETILKDMNLRTSNTDQKIAAMDERNSKFIKEMTTTLKDVKATNDQHFVTIMRFIVNFEKKLEAIYENLAGIDIIQEKLINKINKIEPEQV